MKHWFNPQPVTVPDDLLATVGGHRIVSETLVRRGITQPVAAQKFLNPAHYSPASPDSLPDMDRAVNRIQQAIRRKEPILVWGDFDVDGQTSTALLVSALRELGANVQYHIPNRFSEGHGIHLPTLKRYLDEGAEVVLTCDTGISAHEAVSYAQGRGVDVVITDHHSLPDSLPNAFAAVNPMRLPDGHALRELPGVGTAFQFVRALYGTRSSDHLLDLVALGIVADVMVQVDDTRYWLQRGLDVLRNSPRLGLRTLMERAGVEPSTLSETDIGFTIAPRLNALGRLADANPAVQLLTATDEVIIAERINELEGLNQKRRFLTRQVYEAAQAQIKQDPSLLEYAALVVCGDGWHTGVVGIVASRLVEDYARPVLVLSQTDDRISGSARSVEGANIVKAIRSQSHLLKGYGGHNMAAGLRMDAENLFQFRRGLSQTVREMLGGKAFESQLQIDAEIDFSEIDLNFADDLSRLAPFGNGNPPLTLVTRGVRVKSRRTLGSRGDHVDLRLEDEQGNQQRVVWWFGSTTELPQGKFDIAYTVRANVFKGEREALVEWIDAKPSDDAIELDSKPAYAIVDRRQPDAPITVLADLRAEFPDALVYYEGRSKDIEGIGEADRYHLQGAETLIVWTVPPSPSVWRALIDEVQPQTVVLVGAEKPIFQASELAQVIVGLAKYALKHYAGYITVADIATRTALEEHTIHRAIQWISATTPLHFEPISEDSYIISSGSATTPSSSPQRLQYMLKDTQAYTTHWLKATHR